MGVNVVEPSCADDGSGSGMGQGAPGGAETVGHLAEGDAAIGKERAGYHRRDVG